MSDITTLMMAAAGQGVINPREHFNTVLYNGNSGSNPITGVGFQPDLNWIKARNGVNQSHILSDAVRGTDGTSYYRLFSNLTNAESANSSNGVLSLDSDGFTPSLGGASVNDTGTTYVAWNWKANGAGVSNTAGTITSTVSANTTAGISIVTFTTPAGATDNFSVGHGLGVAPKMVIIKSRASALDWWTWHIGLGDNTTDYLALNLTSAEAGLSRMWGTVGRNSTVIGMGNGASTTASNSMVAYCFAEVEGFSKFGSYTGNGSATGPSVTTDFEPTWLLIKRTDTTGDWILLDSARDATNPRTAYLRPNTFNAEATGNDVDFNATGFQLKSTSAAVNASGGTYIYACFA